MDSEVYERARNQTETFISNIEKTDILFFSELGKEGTLEENKEAFKECEKRLYKNLKLSEDQIPEIADDSYAERLFCSIVLDHLLMDDQSIEKINENADAITTTIAKYMEVIERNTSQDDPEKRRLGILLLKTADYTLMAQSLINRILNPLENKVSRAAETAEKEAHQAAKEAMAASKAAKIQAYAAKIEAREAQSKADEAQKKTSNSVKEILGQIIAILAIFTALAFALVGGTSSLGSMFAENNIEKKEAFFIICIWMIAMLIIIIAMFYFVFVILNILRRPNEDKSSFYIFLPFIMCLICILILVICAINIKVFV